MFEKNIGNIERVFRLMFGLVFGGWVAIQPHLNGIEWFVLIIAMLLILNGVFCRCYLWHILEINTCKADGKECNERTTPC